MNLVNKVGVYLQSGRSWYKRPVSGIAHLVVHHSVTYVQGKTNEQMLRELAQIHYQNGWPGLSYHRVITPDGTVYQINNFDDLTWTDSRNVDSFAVCMVGYFHPPVNMQPTREQLTALKECLDELSTKHPEFPAGEDDVKGHRDRWSTACPGDTLYPYTTEYRTKLGKVDWGGAPAGPKPQEIPVPKPIITPLNDDELRGFLTFKRFFEISIAPDGKPFTSFEGYANWLAQDAYRIAKNPPKSEIVYTAREYNNSVARQLFNLAEQLEGR